MKTKSKRPSAPARRSRDQHRARARLLPPRAWRRYIPRGRALLTPRRRRRPFYSMGFARSAGALDIICAAGEASGSGVWRRLTRGRAQACVTWRRRAGAGREYRGAPSSARCLRAPSSQDPLSIVGIPTHGRPRHRACARAPKCTLVPRQKSESQRGDVPIDSTLLQHAVMPRHRYYFDGQSHAPVRAGDMATQRRGHTLPRATRRRYREMRCPNWRTPCHPRARCPSNRTRSCPAGSSSLHSSARTSRPSRSR